MPEKLILAPFKGLTNKVYRNALSRHIGGFDEMYAPFISGMGDQRVHPSKLTDVLPREENMTHTVPQLISTSASEIGLFAKTLSLHGYKEINWNLGCPFERIADKRRGCGLLPYPEEIDSILDQLYKDMPIKLTIKMRLGYRSSDELQGVIQVLNKYPISAIILHPRIGIQKYKGEVDLMGFRKCLNTSVHPLIYNGDIYNTTKYHQLKSGFPEITSWMLGRGALMNPFLAREIHDKGISSAEKRLALTAFHDELYIHSNRQIPNEKKHLGWMKAIWYYMSGIFSEGAGIFSTIKTAQSQADYLAVTEAALTHTFASDAELESYFRYSIVHI